MLNRGRFLTPVGASDSHDVSRYIVGQARTYIRCDSTDPGNIDVAQAVRNLHDGRVMVSYGLVGTSKWPEDMAPAIWFPPVWPMPKVGWT